MEPFYSNIPPQDALEIEQLARLMYELRSARDEVLTRLPTAATGQALAGLRHTDRPAHPAYEHDLSARILADLAAQARADLAARIEESQGR